MGYKYNDQHRGSSDLYEKFSSSIINFINSLSQANWEKPWNSKTTFAENISGRQYKGSNQVMLSLASLTKGYNIPVYMTYKQAKEHGATPLRGEKSTPIIHTKPFYKDKEGNSISEDEYNKLPEAEKDNYQKRFGNYKLYNVFNIDQTNYQQIHPEKYEELRKKFVPEPLQVDSSRLYTNEALDRLVNENKWVCPIYNDKQNESAFFSPSTNIINIPSKQAFQTTGNNVIDGQKYYATMLHEMAHSTGVLEGSSRDLTGFKETKKYAREELVAELSAAMVGLSLGFDKKILQNNGNYLKSWLGALRNDPKEITNAMKDVSKATGVIYFKMNEQLKELNQPIISAANAELNMDNAFKVDSEKLKDLPNVERIDNQQTKKKPFPEDKVFTSKELENLYHNQDGLNIIEEYDNKIKASQPVKKEKTLLEIELQYDRINSQYPFVVNNEATRQIAKRIRQAEEITTAYHNNIAAVYGDKWLFSKAAETTQIPKDIYTGKENVLYRATPEELPQYEEKDKKASISVGEDQDPSTNISEAVKAKIESENIPKEQAIKEVMPELKRHTAKQEAEQKQKIAATEAEEIKRKVEQQEQDEKRKRFDTKEVSRRSEEEHRKNEKGDGNLLKIAITSGLLLSALEAAKGNKGIWLNKSGKSNAEFVGQSRPITPYNNLMMNLNADKEGYRTNKYVFSGQNKGDGNAIKSGEHSLPFNWVNWQYQNIETKELISSKEYKALPDIEKSMYASHAERKTNHIFNIDQTLMGKNNREAYISHLKQSGQTIEDIKNFSSIPVYNEQKLTSSYPKTVALFEKDDNMIETFGRSAKTLEQKLKLPSTKETIDDKEVNVVRFNKEHLDNYMRTLLDKGHKVALVNSQDSPQLVKALPNVKEVLWKAQSIAEAVAKESGAKIERVMIPQEAKYDKQSDTITLSSVLDNNPVNERTATLERANSVYRSLVAMIGTEDRLDRLGRSNLLPKDDAKYEKFVQEVSAGIMMARQGLPATISKENQQLIPYWEKEIKENPGKMLAMLERDINNSVDNIQRLANHQQVNYNKIRNEVAPKEVYEAKDYTITTKLSEFPNIDSKEIIIIKDPKNSKADVILPEGASMKMGEEIKGMRKERIVKALEKQGIQEVNFYNAEGFLALKQNNDYFKGKEISMDRLKQYELTGSRAIDIQKDLAPKVPKIEVFTHIKSDEGKWHFFIRPEGEPSFAIEPDPQHLSNYFASRKTNNSNDVKKYLADTYYTLANNQPQLKKDLIMPKIPEGLNLEKIERPTITKDANDRKKYVMATIDDKFEKQEISENLWQKMWQADDMAAYKKAVAAITFAPKIQLEQSSEEKQVSEEKTSVDEHQSSERSKDTTENLIEDLKKGHKTLEPIEEDNVEEVEEVSKEKTIRRGGLTI